MHSQDNKKTLTPHIPQLDHAEKHARSLPHPPASLQPLHKARPCSQPSHSQLCPQHAHSSRPYHNRKAPTAHIRAPLDYTALVTRGEHAAGPMGHLLHEASSPRLGNVTIIRNKHRELGKKNQVRKQEHKKNGKNLKYTKIHDRKSTKH